MANLINTIRSMNEAPEDNMPASPDEGKMAYAQCEFIEYASEEICDYIENGGNFPEWFQNKLTKAHEQMKDLHAFIEGEKRATGTGQDPEEMDEAMDPVNKKALKKDFDDRKDKDIDNDGDTDDSDEYLHNRRKAVSKAIKGEGKGEKVDVKPKLDEEALDEAKVTHSDKSAPGKGKALKDMSKDDHIKSIEHHEREMSIADKKGQSYNVKHHQMMAKVHRVNAQGGSSMMHKEEVDIYEAVTVKLRGGKVPVGQHKFIYKVDKSPKYIENSIKERDKNAKVEVKGKDVHVTASAGAHSSFIDSLRKFRANGTVTEEIQMDDMQEGTMSRYELIKKAAQKVNKADAKAARDAAKGIKKDKDLKKVKKDPADMDEEVITEGNAAAELKKYANSKGGIDKQDFIAIANMLAKKKSAKDLAMVLKAQDTDPRDKALEIISKNDNKLYHEILKAARGMMPKKTIKKPNLRAQYEEVELEEDYKKDAKNAPFEADPEKKKQKNSDGSETKPMSRAKQLAKKGLVSEAEMTPAQKRKKEEIVKGMKDKKDYFERKYGDRAKDVMYATATKMAMKEGFELSEETLAELSRDTLSSYKKKAQDSAAKNMIGSKGDVKTMDKRISGIKKADKKLDQKNKEASMKKEAYVAPSDGGPDGGGTPPKYTTKNGTNYKNGKAIGPVSDPDGGSATPAPKKEEKEVKEMVGKNGTVTPSKLAKNDADKQGVGVKYSQGGSGKVGLSSTDTAQPFAGATSAKKATVSPVQRLRNLLGK